METWKTLHRRLVMDQGKFLQVELHTVELPGGRTITDWPWVITPDFVNVVAITQEGKYLCFRQVKYAISGTSLAPVGGYIEPGEDPLTAARRELLEETGYTSQDWTFLGQTVVDANRGAGKAHFFMARNACQVAERDADDLEEQELLLVDRQILDAAIQAGEIQILPWLTSFLLAFHSLA
jgi:ADP-ribose pyrophosphatase